MVVRHKKRLPSRVSGRRFFVAPSSQIRAVDRRHPLQPRLRIIPKRPLVENRDPETTPALHPWHRNRNCKSKASVSDANRCRRCRKPGKYSRGAHTDNAPRSLHAQPGRRAAATDRHLSARPHSGQRWSLRLSIGCNACSDILHRLLTDSNKTGARPVEILY